MHDLAPRYRTKTQKELKVTHPYPCLLLQSSSSKTQKELKGHSVHGCPCLREGVLSKTQKELKVTLFMDTGWTGGT